MHTNRLENFWSLLKRAIRGTYVSVEPFHLYRYLDEQSFRYNERRRYRRSTISKGPELHRWKAIAMERADLPGGGVMSERNDKNAVEEKKPLPKPPGYRKFEKLLKQVIKAPPMREKKAEIGEAQ